MVMEALTLIQVAVLLVAINMIQGAGIEEETPSLCGPRSAPGPLGLCSASGALALQVGLSCK